MKKILSFSDAHLGLKSYSIQESNGLFTAEIDARNALDSIIDRASQGDIETIIFNGDFFHTNHPTSLNIEWAISWLQRLDALGIISFFIPGNHDASVYSNSMAFMRELNLKNIFLIDEKFLESNKDFIHKFGKWNVVFAPYISSLTLRDKDAITHSFAKYNLDNAQSNTIVVTHIHESSARLGSEQVLISRGVDIIDVDSLSKDNLILLTGHIHKHQIYDKKNIKVVYPGSLYYMDSTDLDEDKGYVTIDEEGTILFEKTKNVRHFAQYTIEDGVDPVDYFSNIRMSPNQVIFLRVESDGRINEPKFREFLKDNGCYYGKVTYPKLQANTDNLKLGSNITDKNALFKEYMVNNKEIIDSHSDAVKEKINNIGLEILSKY